MSLNCARYLEILTGTSNHEGLCHGCCQSYQRFISDIAPSIENSVDKLSPQDKVFLFLHRRCTLGEVVRHLGVESLVEFIPTAEASEKAKSRLAVIEVSSLILRYRAKRNSIEQ